MKQFRFLFVVLSLCLLASCSHSQNLADSTNAGCYPLPGAKVISPYKNNRGSHRHTGVDLKTKPNDPIYAVYDGVVTMSKSYYHNSKNYVKEGEKVRCGQKIALTGRTGRATTEHLHFEVRKNGKPVNPMPLLEKLSKKMQGK